jgi:thiol-disulfide isomerase/thioredoxin
MNIKPVLIVWVALMMHMGQVGAVEVGKSMPAIDIEAIQPSKGQYIYLDYWASWCGPCRQSFPWMNALQAKYAAKGLKVVAVNVDAKRADADKFLTHTPAQFTVAYDPLGESAKKLAIKTMPTSMLISPEGKVLLVHSGFRTEEGASLEGKIAAAMNGAN